MSTPFKKVLQMMEVFGQETPYKIKHPDETVFRLRVRLMVEEFFETLYAMSHLDYVEIADGIADCEVVNLGTAVAFGIPMDEVFNIVHESNMSKATKEFDGTYSVIKDEYGKVQKPSTYFKPTPFIERILSSKDEDEVDNIPVNYDPRQVLLEEYMNANTKFLAKLKG